MATQARAAYGAKLLRYNGTSYATLEEVTGFTGPASKVKAIDVTSMDSSGVAEFIAGILDSGTISFDINYVLGTNQVLAYGDFTGRVTGLWKIELPGTQPAAGYFTFSAIVTQFSMDFKIQDRITSKMELQVTGPISFQTTS